MEEFDLNFVLEEVDLNNLKENILHIGLSIDWIVQVDLVGNH